MRSTVRQRFSAHNSFNHQSLNAGVVLFVALIVLVVMSLAGIGLMRSVIRQQESRGISHFGQAR